MREKTCDLNKKGIRQSKLQLRAKIPNHLRIELSKRIRIKTLSLEILKRANSISCYKAMQNEVKTSSIIENLLLQNKAVQVPVVTSDEEMNMKPYVRDNVVDDLKSKCTLAPENVIETEPEVTLIPVVAISRSGNRIGYGRGYYDRWLSKNRNTRKIALAFHCQISAEIIPERHDEPVEIIVTEKEIIYCKDQKGYATT